VGHALDTMDKRAFTADAACSIDGSVVQQNSPEVFLAGDE